MELQDYLDETQPVETGFTVDTEEKANWALRKIRQFKEKALANIKLAKSEIDRIKAWEEAENKGLTDSITYFEGLLQGYAEKQRQADPKFKSVKLPYGVMRFKKQQPEFKREDKDLVSFLKESGLKENYVETKEEPKWGEFKKVSTVEKRVFKRFTLGEEMEALTPLKPADYTVTSEGKLCKISTGEIHPDLIIKDVLVYKGNIVDGVTVVEREDKFEVEV